MRPIFFPPTQTKVRRDPILGRDPWFGNLGSRIYDISNFESLGKFLKGRHEDKNVEGRMAGRVHPQIA